MALPNILYIHSHDTNRHTQPYGYAVHTPHIQGLAEEGVLFRECFCMAPTCSPSRAALVTGQCPHSSGMLGLAHRGFALRDYTQHIAHTLRKVGYRSTLIGVQHVAVDPEVIGYDQVVKPPSHHAVDVAPAAVKFLREAGGGPFFLSVGFSETHRPFPVPGPDDDPRYCLPPHNLPDTPVVRADIAGFMASARILDAGIGAVLEALETNGLADDTLVICTTDHGMAFPGMKCNLSDGGIGVMLIIRGPGGFAGGRVCDGLVSQMDIFPTICELLGIEPPAWLQGKSFMPLIRGEADHINEAIYAEVNYHAAYEPMRAVRTRRWKYIRRFEERQGPVLPNCDDSPSKELWMEHGWATRAPACEQLYDLVFDPYECCNLVGDPSASEILADMRDRLDSWMERTDDPLLFGPVVAPPGARVNDPDGASPKDPTRTID